MKRPNLRIIGIEEGEEEAQLKVIENIFNKNIEETFSKRNLKKDVPVKVQ